MKAIVRTTLVAAICNTFLAIGKILCGWLGNSHALIADGVHSVSDLLSDLLVYFAGRHAGEAPDEEHPYGHQRFETVATLILGIFLAAVALGIAWDAVQRLFEPEQLLRPGWLALAAAAVSILVNEALFWYTLFYAKRVRSDMLRANAWHHRTDAISSVVVLIGIAGTLAGLNYLDAVASVLVAVMIAKIAWDLGNEAVGELVDAGLEPARVGEIREAITGIADVRDLHMLRTRTHGGQASADVHVLVDPYISVSEGHMISVLVEKRLKAGFDEISEVIVHIDPEDDEIRPVRADLPLRAQALQKLEQLCAGIPEFAERRRVLLHYLHGALEVEILLPLTLTAGAGHDPEKLASRIRHAIGKDPVFRQARVYFG
ncbi:cation diffusion facilitator family transporter [Thiorhodovibrio frisius]|uniref:Cation diffusion facilitator family transporter n=1 Tax=Thiorhodovibrio frisius TaxID=631362 RepID=H8YZG8_9GAMM|nr:cation diffusion facilitator family transporter [Thiorhodovibrio frisius]EIC22095.1 cation diffusion facilitator family transporter [Thiorhodovibrio frisius]WPL24388.1 Ferrous-iron efflux pump FieF [Thiorhodovibrio frisius]